MTDVLHTLTEAEFELTLAAQQAELEAKVALADFEVDYHEGKARLVSQVVAASEMRQVALGGILRARGMDPSEWVINVASQSFERAGGATGLLDGMSEVLLEHDSAFQPLSSDEELEQARSDIASVRLTRPSNGGSDETH